MISGKNVVLTGANSGIGLEMLRILVQNGNRVLAADLNIDRISDDAMAYVCDISDEDGVNKLFIRAEEEFGKIDVFIANAGYNHYEIMDGSDWKKVDRIFRTNTISPIYSYQKYIEHLKGSDGIFVMTISAMGKMAMPGFTLYSATKFALNGFQEAVRLERPDNVQITCVYPVSTDTAFFDSPAEIEKPYPVQSPELVAMKALKGIEKGKKKVFPSKLFRFATVLFTILPPVKWLYLKKEKEKVLRHEKRLKEL